MPSVFLVPFIVAIILRCDFYTCSCFTTRLSLYKKEQRPIARTLVLCIFTSFICITYMITNTAMSDIIIMSSIVLLRKYYVKHRYYI